MQKENLAILYLVFKKFLHSDEYKKKEMASLLVQSK